MYGVSGTGIVLCISDSHGQYVNFGLFGSFNNIFANYCESGSPILTDVFINAVGQPDNCPVTLPME